MKMLKSIWKAICLFCFHLWWGWDAFELVFASDFLQRREVIQANNNNRIIYVVILSRSKKVDNGYKYVVRII